MGRRSWLHPIYCKEDYDKLLEFTELDEYKNELLIVGIALIEGEVLRHDRIGGSIGEKNKKTLMVLTQSDGNWIVDELIAKGVIEDWYIVTPLGNLHPSEIEYTSKGGRVKKAKYLSYEEFLNHLEELETSPLYNNAAYKEELALESELKSTGHLFMGQVAKIIVGVFSYLEQKNHLQIESLFNNATSLYNALGSWVFGGCSPKIVYPELKLLVKKADEIEVDDFSDIVGYIIWVGNGILKTMEKHQHIEEDYFESYTLKQDNDTNSGLILMWRLGWFTEKIMATSRAIEEPILLEPFKAFDNLFSAFGRWIFAQESVEELYRCFRGYEKALEIGKDPVFDVIMNEAKITSENTSRFLKKIEHLK